jgi:hypothetical protein
VAAHVHDLSHAAGARIELTIAASARGYEGTLVASDERGQQGSRRIEGKTCVEVAHALAFLAGLAIELGGRVEPDASPHPHTESRVPAPAPARPVAAAPPRSIDVSLALLEGARGGFASSPRTSGELAFEIGGARGLLAPSLRVAGFLGRSHLELSASETSGQAPSGDLRFFGGRLELCPLRFGNAEIALRPCFGGELGTVDAQGHIAVQPRSATETWASAEATLRLQWFAARSFFAEASGGAVLPVERTRYYFEPDRTLYRVPWLTARGAVGVGVRF